MHLSRAHVPSRPPVHQHVIWQTDTTKAGVMHQCCISRAWDASAMSADGAQVAAFAEAHGHMRQPLIADLCAHHITV